jgi:N4-gp56 family major capsid protein
MANTIGTNAVPGNTYLDPGRYYDRRFLERLTPQLVLKQCGEMRPLPQRNGTLIKWHRLNKLVAALTPLTENVTPTEETVSTVEITAEPLTFGSWVRISTELNLKTINPIVEEIQDEQADQAALTYDTILFNELHNGVTNQFAGTAVSEITVADADVMNASELRKAVFTLRSTNVPGFDKNMYKLVIHPASQFDLLSDSQAGSFVDASKHTTFDGIMKGEIGSLYGARIVVTQNLPTGTGATDPTYRSFLFGRQTFGITELAQHGVKTFRFKDGNTENPLMQYSTIGWKFIMAAKVLDASRAVEIYAGSGADN